MGTTTARILTAAAVLLLSAMGGRQAAAQRYTNYPVCAVYSFRTESCAFMNFAQCYMSVSGRGGYCQVNPFYEPPRARRAAKRKRS